MFRLKLAGGVESRFFAEADIQKPLRNEGLEDPDGKCFRAGELHLAGCGSLQALGVVLVYAKLLIKLGAQILSPHPTRSNPNLLILILIARSLYRFNQRLEAYMMQLSVSKIS
jgi:hypothetical protein